MWKQPVSVLKFRRRRKGPFKRPSRFARKRRNTWERRPRVWPKVKLLLPTAVPFAAILGIWAFTSGISLNDLKWTGSEPSASRLHRVIDGDTIEATVTGYGRSRIRLSSIDAPESSQPYGSQSTECLRDILRQGPLSVKPKKTDRYGRLIANLYVNGERVDVQMVERGCAWWYSRYSSSPALIKAHLSAKFNKRGLWADSDPVKPETWRRRHQSKQWL